MRCGAAPQPLAAASQPSIVCGAAVVDGRDECARVMAANANGSLEPSGVMGSPNKGPEMTTDTRDARNSADPKSSEYLRELMEEKHKLDSNQWPNAARLLDQGKAHTCTTAEPVATMWATSTGHCAIPTESWTRTRSQRCWAGAVSEVMSLSRSPVAVPHPAAVQVLGVAWRGAWRCRAGRLPCTALAGPGRAQLCHQAATRDPAGSGLWPVLATRKKERRVHTDPETQSSLARCCRACRPVVGSAGLGTAVSRTGEACQCSSCLLLAAVSLAELSPPASEQ